MQYDTKWQRTAVLASARNIKFLSEDNLDIIALKPTCIKVPMNWHACTTRWGHWHVSSYNQNKSSISIIWRRLIKQEKGD